MIPNSTEAVRIETTPAPVLKRRRCAHCGRRTTKRCAIAVQRFVERPLSKVNLRDYVELPQWEKGMLPDSELAKHRGKVMKLGPVLDHMDWWCRHVLELPAAQCIMVTIIRRNEDGSETRHRHRLRPDSIVKVRVWRICRKPCCSRCRMAPGPDRYVCRDHWPEQL